MSDQAPPNRIEPKLLSRLHQLNQADVDHCFDLLRILKYQMETADRKAQVTFAANTLLVAALALIPQLRANQAIVPSPSSLSNVQLILTIGLLGFIFYSSFCVLLTLLPRLLKQPQTSLYYFGDIATLSADEYIDTTFKFTDAARAEQVMLSLHTLARLLQTKYYWANRAARSLAWALGLWGIVQLVSILA